MGIEAKKLAKVPVSDADLSTVYRFGDGGLSPRRPDTHPGDIRDTLFGVFLVTSVSVAPRPGCDTGPKSTDRRR